MKYIKILLLIVCSINAFSQSKSDSLYTVWNNKSATFEERANALEWFINSEILRPFPDSALILCDTLIVWAQNNGSYKFERKGNYIKSTAMRFRGTPGEGIPFAERGYTLAVENKDSSSQGFYLHQIGILYAEIEDEVKAINYFSKSIEMQKLLGNKLGMAQSYNGIGLIYLEQGDLERAFEYITTCVELLEERGIQEAIAHFSLNLAGLFELKGDDQKALEIYEKCLAIRESRDTKESKVWVVVILAEIGEIYEERGKHTISFDYFTKALALAREEKNLKGMATCYNAFSRFYESKGDLDSALHFVKMSYNSFEESGFKPGMASNLNRMGQLYKEQSKYRLMVNHCERAYQLATEVDALKVRISSCECLTEGYKFLGNTAKALSYFQLSTEFKDSLRKEETNIKLQQMEFAKAMLQDSIAKAEEARLVQAAHEQEMRKEEKTRNISFGVGAALLLLAGGLYTRVRNIRKSKAVLQVEKDRSENLLLNILPEEIAQELKEKGKAEARDFDLVSILFTDFKGFTEQSAKLSAADLVNEINHCFEAFDGIMEKFGIEKIKTIGDAYMAAGGLPVPTDDSVKNTVLAAIEMQAFIAKRKAENDAANKPAFEMRVGIHTGPVVAGIVGVKKFQYDIWGDTVNTASRMESAGEVGKVNISQATYELLKDASTSSATALEFKFESRGKIEAKGKGEMEMYFVTKRS